MKKTTGINWRTLLRFILSLGLAVAAIWFISRELDLAAVGRSLRAASPLYVAAGLLVIVVTGFAKAWRWQQLFAPAASAPAWTQLYWSMLLGQIINVLLWRLGDLARAYDLNQRTGRSKTLILGTIVVEKSLHFLFVLLTLVLVLPFIVVPQLVQTPAKATAWILLPLLLAMYLLAYQTDWVIGLIRRVAVWLPAPLESRLLKMSISGLEGLAALRSKRAVAMLLFSSALITLLEVATPLIIFKAFDFPFGLREAALLNLTLSIGTVPPSTPLKIGVFEWLTIFLLDQFGGVAESAGFSYALVFHGVVLMPILILGTIAFQRSRWQWPSWRLR